MPKVLTDDQIQHFVQHGYTKLEAAYPVAQAMATQDFLWAKLEALGVRRDDPSTWTKPMVHLNESYDDPVFTACLTARLCDAVEDLVGRGRYSHYGDRSIPWGWWPVNFSRGAELPWDVPPNGWHWDGIQFKHTVYAPEEGLLQLCMFSDTRPHSGGTLVVAGSHHVVARFLNQHPEGLDLGPAIKGAIESHPWLRDLTNAAPTPSDAPSRVERFMNQTTIDDHGSSLRVVETTADAGDVYLCHPFLIHTPSQNHSGRPRFMCNRMSPLREPMKLDRADSDYSAVERSIRMALGRG